MTTLWHAGTGLPWDWRIGAADSSEREHWKDMLPQLPENALVTADAGFVGFEYVQAVIASGRHLLLRVGANVRLLRELGYAREQEGVVYLWPDQQAKAGQAPLMLRLVTAQGGKHPVYLVTSVLDTRRLSDTQVIELYRRRWGIELFYRHLKQTFARRKLRSGNAENARVEMEWSLLGLWGMGLYAQVQLTRAKIEPKRLSVAKMLRGFRRTLRDYRHPIERGTTLCGVLSEALIDEYPRKNKTSRNYPRKKQEKPPGPPHIQLATRAQIAQAKLIQAETQKGLSA
ncbi:MAG: transposase [Rhodospirillales bacterium]|nr:transposase [Rhodospirillales bacterium]